MTNIKFVKIQSFHYIKRRITDWLGNDSNRLLIILWFIDPLFIYFNDIGQNCFPLILRPLINIRNEINIWNNKHVKLNKRPRDWIRDSLSSIFMPFGFSEGK